MGKHEKMIAYRLPLPHINRWIEHILRVGHVHHLLILGWVHLSIIEHEISIAI